ncbi:NapC/NirT family cytochrome c [Neobacillus sp. PS3-40]|uniref:cytochrome c3 family protein n=1 Tax=Neobacillus sp. PS3-40 TaxID=3070679 RepID=UPI0027E0318E|nr:NapC/NirT family cytochrome c [Neobacillus sp. PS3-40]WML46051.1 NapC/NirT family cytochrome c [Neobacillus sp. PS3-40]
MDSKGSNKNTVKWYKLLFGGIIVCIAILASGFGVVSYTNSPTFCSSCHEMAPEHLTYSTSAHNQVSCVQCHVKPGFINMMTSKKQLLKEVYVHFKGIPEQIVQTKDQVVSSQSCLQCHSKNRLITATGDLKVNHPGHVKQGIPCITCHSGVAHAKIAARGLNVSKDQDKWTKATTEKLIEEKYSRPNMGTCIDCHDKVNNGEKPWKDITYTMTANPKKMQNSNNGSPEATTAEIVEEVQNAEAVQNKKTQGLILQAIGKQKKNVKISMECKTCHKIVKVPKLHKNPEWPVNHGSTAMKELNKCLNCHQDSKWVKDVPQESITSLLELRRQKVNYTLNYELVKEQSRTNKFCSTCHSSKPPSHTQSNWAPGHAVASADDNEKLKCYICHDKDTPPAGSTAIKAPAQSCQHCHKYFE